MVGLYFAEIADKEIRGNLTLVTRFMFNFGSLLIMSIGPFVSYDTLNYLLLSLPLIFFVACWAIPESPYFYLKEGKVDAARKTLEKLRGNVDEKVFVVFPFIIIVMHYLSSTKNFVFLLIIFSVFGCTRYERVSDGRGIPTDRQSGRKHR